MEPQNDAAYSQPSWQETLKRIKVYVKEKVDSLKANHEGNEDGLAKSPQVKVASRTSDIGGTMTTEPKSQF